MKNKRIFLPNIITPEEAKILREDRLLKTVASSEIIEEVKRVINRTLYHINWRTPTRIGIEIKPSGHKSQVDTGGDYGSKGHMQWCSWGCSLLLTDDEDAGHLEYKDGTKLLPKEHFCGLAIHSSDVEHCVPKNKTRIALLLFLQRKL